MMQLDGQLDAPNRNVISRLISAEHSTAISPVVLPSPDTLALTHVPHIDLRILSQCHQLPRPSPRSARPPERLDRGIRLDAPDNLSPAARPIHKVHVTSPPGDREDLSCRIKRADIHALVLGRGI